MAWLMHSFADNETLVTALAREIATMLREAIGARGRAAIAVSGGSTPRTLFDALAGIDLPWAQVVVTLVDERWVDGDDPASNALLVRRHLLQGFAAAASFVELKTASPDPFAAVAAVDAQLRARVLPLDIAVLGVGDDGHTASFFSGSKGFDVALSPQTREACAGVTPTGAPHNRMTLTLNTLLGARRLVLHCIGEKKLSVLHAAMQPGTVSELPVRAVLHQERVPVEIYHATH
ncbi:MAG: 6-phosphogluconolactonase [Gammaproteobacteria bacterium RIFCSPLOWO2_02_FULL_57_10]|nr:MAG: 6-phosphogluconolactonase [Gammaproteobacteria bacterium RIFCSPLOWO2_02_FULL_57_10]